MRKQDATILPLLLVVVVMVVVVVIAFVVAFPRESAVRREPASVTPVTGPPNWKDQPKLRRLLRQRDEAKATASHSPSLQVQTLPRASASPSFGQ
jgi:hypothetical protein